MKAVLYICHGTRVKEGAKQAADFIKETMPLVDAPIQEICYLELSEPSIEEGLRACIERGATDIIAIPFLLLTAGHAKEDIPGELANAAKHFPQAVIRYGHPLGVHEQIIDVLIDRMKEAASIQPDASVLLVGRGSSDPATKEDFSRILHLFKNKTKLTDVHIGYMAACEPAFEDALREVAVTNPKQLFIVPYLLFTGILTKTMDRAVKKLKLDGDIHLCRHLGYDPVIGNILAKRVEEAAQSEPVCFPL
ncbi:sirohydrochlorin chelatase [Domibacillus sp. A3M-37]|uniref:sirohydrochlorin chelatase n=1 Tax=Domibacillus sp. A3M-37 TaxID=2962037 RepID=UPI0020B80948|nr:CbiX/SirB N-terminal domain-containing protein [Domibacillus sp. A3M-37]MCP3762798.1 sirohydrochlorin chelatase [Domibacillus sp. A3M-37]